MCFPQHLPFLALIAPQILNSVNCHVQYPNQDHNAEYEEIPTFGNGEISDNVFCVFCAAIRL